jgi:hypothetical protein
VLVGQGLRVWNTADIGATVFLADACSSDCPNLMAERAQQQNNNNQKTKKNVFHTGASRRQRAGDVTLCSMTGFVRHFVVSLVRHITMLISWW